MNDTARITPTALPGGLIDLTVTKGGLAIHVDLDLDQAARLANLLLAEMALALAWRAPRSIADVLG